MSNGCHTHGQKIWKPDRKSSLGHYPASEQPAAHVYLGQSMFNWRDTKMQLLKAGKNSSKSKSTQILICSTKVNFNTIKTNYRWSSRPLHSVSKIHFLSKIKKKQDWKCFSDLRPRFKLNLQCNNLNSNSNLE